MKKVTFKNNLGLTLVGSLWKSSSEAIIVMAHGSSSNRKSQGLFEKLASSFQTQGYNVLTFDFTGHGESDDGILTLAQSVEDAKSAVQFCKEQKYKQFAFLGHSLGAYSCLGAFTPDIKTMVLLGALTGPVLWKWEDMCSQEQLEGLRKSGYVTAEVNDGLRKIIKIDGNLLNDIENIDQQKLLRPITCPVLIIHGIDSQEKDLLPFSKQALALLPKGSELKILPEIDHTFIKGIDEVTQLTVQWYKKYFPINAIYH
jgi:pimeloyl-ACP methyl ester carboxylesterase